MFQGKTESFSTQSTMASEPPTSMKLNRLLLVSKLSRYDFERYRHVDLSEHELETALRKRGADYDSLIKNHKLHKEFEQNVKKAFEDAGIEARVVNRYLSKSIKIYCCVTLTHLVCFIVEYFFFWHPDLTTLWTK